MESSVEVGEKDTVHFNFHMKDEETRAGGPIFNPPVYMQRYGRVRQCIEEFPEDGPLKVVDFGSSEMYFVEYVKSVSKVGEIVCVDVDWAHLNHHKHRAGPTETDFMRLRSFPLKVKVMCGSVIDWDEVLAGVHVVTAIELIEHLEADVLDKFPEAIFGRIRPKLAVITTPNADFNSLFRNFSGSRHPDHKFEWTREEFRNWCSDCCERFGYKCDFSGIGDPRPTGNLEEHGHCSQMAVFYRDDENKIRSGEYLGGKETRGYDLVEEFEFPYQEETNPEEWALGALSSALHECAQLHEDYFFGISIYVHLSEAVERLESAEQELGVFEELDIRNLLESAGFDVVDEPPPESRIRSHEGPHRFGSFYIGVTMTADLESASPEEPPSNSNLELIPAVATASTPCSTHGRGESASALSWSTQSWSCNVTYSAAPNSESSSSSSSSTTSPLSPVNYGVFQPSPTIPFYYFPFPGSDPAISAPQPSSTRFAPPSFFPIPWEHQSHYQQQPLIRFRPRRQNYNPNTQRHQSRGQNYQSKRQNVIVFPICAVPPRPPNPVSFNGFIPNLGPAFPAPLFAGGSLFLPPPVAL